MRGNSLSHFQESNLKAWKLKLLLCYVGKLSPTFRKATWKPESCRNIRTAARKWALQSQNRESYSKGGKKKRAIRESRKRFERGLPNRERELTPSLLSVCESELRKLGEAMGGEEGRGFFSARRKSGGESCQLQKPHFHVLIVGFGHGFWWEIEENILPWLETM